LKYRLRIKRFDPERDQKAHWEKYEVDLEPDDRLLDALNLIRWEQDGTFALRRSCQHGICGSDAVCVNGRNALACKLLLKDIKQPIVVEPIKGFRVIKDLVVDFDRFFEQYRSVMPYQVREGQLPERERLQTPQAAERIADTANCILCACCTTSCPSFWANKEFLGPAAIVQAHRFIFDSRDQGTGERLSLVGDRMGVWRCRTIFNCTDCCPRSIKITKAIGEVKKALLGGIE